MRPLFARAGLRSLSERARIIAYRVMRKLGTASECRLFVVSCDSVVGPDVPRSLRHVVLTQSDIGHMLLVNRHESKFARAVEEDGIVGIGIAEHNKLVAHVWLHANYVPGEHNHTGNTDTELSLVLGKKTLYLFNAFVSPEFRGRRLYAAMVRIAAEKARLSGYDRIVMTTEITNSSALKSADRMGFRLGGYTRLWKFGPFVSEERRAILGDVKFGSYAGAS